MIKVFLEVLAVVLVIFWLTQDRVRVTFKRKIYNAKPIPFSEYSFCGFAIVLYLFIVFLSLSAFFKFRTYPNHYMFLIGGMFLFIGGRRLRNLAIYTLGKNWNITTSALNVKRVMRVGAYKYSRHPYYLASWLELLGFSVAGPSLPALLILLLLYIPMAFYRMNREEKDLIKKTGDKYLQYQRETRKLFSPQKFIKEAIANLSLIQVYRLLSHYGIAHILRMQYVHRSILRYARGYMVSSCFGALFEVGFIDELEREGEINLSSFSQKERLSPYYLHAICDYLYVLNFLNREGQNY